MFPDDEAHGEAGPVIAVATGLGLVVTQMTLGNPMDVPHELIV
jgi:hypothetical protein